MQEQEAPKGQYDKWYYYELRLTNKGVANAAHATAEELRQDLENDLKSVYGEGSFEIVEIRDASPDEIDVALKQKAMMDDMFGDDIEEDAPVLN